MKKVLLTGSMMLAASGALAQNALSGIYLGAGVGMQRGTYNQKLDAGLTTGAGLGNSVKGASYPFIGEVSLGYYQDCNNLNYGAKFSVGTAFNKRSKRAADTATYQSIRTNVSQNYSLGLVGQLGGYVAEKTVVYGTFGVKRTRFDLEVYTANIGSKTVGKDLWAPVVGFGVKTALDESWVFNADVTYEWYQKARTGNVANVNGRVLGTSVQPRLWNLTVGLSHRF